MHHENVHAKYADLQDRIAQIQRRKIYWGLQLMKTQKITEPLIVGY